MSLRSYAKYKSLQCWLMKPLGVYTQERETVKPTGNSRKHYRKIPISFLPSFNTHHVDPAYSNMQTPSTETKLESKRIVRSYNS